MLGISCSENSDSNQAGQENGNRVVTYPCSKDSLTIEYMGESVIVTWINENEEPQSLDLSETRTAKGRRYANGKYALSIFDDKIQWNKPNYPKVICSKNKLTTIVYPELDTTANLISQVEKIAAQIDNVTNLTDPTEIYTKDRDAGYSKFPISVWFYQNNPVKIVISDMNGTDEGDLVYYLPEGKLLYGKTNKSKYIFNKDGRLILWTDSKNKSYDLSPADYADRAAGMKEELDRYIMMSKALR